MREMKFGREISHIAFVLNQENEGNCRCLIMNDMDHMRLSLADAKSLFIQIGSALGRPEWEVKRFLREIPKDDQAEGGQENKLNDNEISSLYKFIMHGNDKHKAWLRQAICDWSESRAYALPVQE